MATPLMDKWNRVAAIFGEDMKKIAWVTSDEWGRIADELVSFDVVDPSKPEVRPNPRNFRAMKIGTGLTLKNAGTEDQEVVNTMNLIELGEADYKKFCFRRDNFVTGRA